MLPAVAKEQIVEQIRTVRMLHAKRVARGGGFIELPGAFDRKSSSATAKWSWCWLFPAAREYWHDATAQLRTHHLHPTVLQRAAPLAAREASLQQRVTCHTFRHCFGTHLLEAGYDIRTVQELMGHKDVATTMIYTHVLNKGGLGVRSPLDMDPRS